MNSRYQTPDEHKEWYSTIHPAYAEAACALINEFLEKFDPEGLHEVPFYAEMFIRKYLNDNEKLGINMPEHVWNYHVLLALEMIDPDPHFVREHIPEAGYVPPEIRKANEERVALAGFKNSDNILDDEERGENRYVEH